MTKHAYPAPPVSQQEPQAAQSRQDDGSRRQLVIIFGVLGTVLLLVLILVVALSGGSTSGNSSSANQSISYKDGYVCGQDIVAGSNEACTILTGSFSDQTSADSNCNFDSSPLDNGDNVDQWMQGCMDGVNDAFYQQAHPGA